MADGQARRLPGRPSRSGQHTGPSGPSTAGVARDTDPAQRRGDGDEPHASENSGDPAEHRVTHRGEHDPGSADRGDDLQDTGDSAADHPRGAAAIGRRAAALVCTLSGRPPESVVSIERSDGGWRVGVEVVEVARIPDSADILAVYQVRLDEDGDLVSYQRTRRYPRGQLEREHHR